MSDIAPNPIPDEDTPVREAPDGLGPSKPKGGKPTRADAEQIALRRIRVERLELAGASRRQIAEAVGVSVGTVGDDLKAIRAARREAVGSGLVAEERDLELARLEQQRNRIEIDQALRTDEKARAEGRRPELTMWQAQRLLLQIAERKARLLGLDAPRQVELLGGTEDTEGLEEAEREPTLAEALGLGADVSGPDLAKVLYLQLKERRAG